MALPTLNRFATMSGFGKQLEQILALVPEDKKDEGIECVIRLQQYGQAFSEAMLRLSNIESQLHHAYRDINSCVVRANAPKET